MTVIHLVVFLSLQKFLSLLKWLKNMGWGIFLFKSIEFINLFFPRKKQKLKGWP